MGINRTHDLRIRSTVTLPTELQGRTEKHVQHEIQNLRIFIFCVKNRKYKASSLRAGCTLRKDA